MRILLTNDDGIFAPGIQRLCQELEQNHEVVVVAPDRERSATGHAITIHHPLRAKEMTFANIKSKCIAIDGTPADCVKIAIESLLDEKPDLVISGINAGPNMGYDVLYSGTVSAAVEGLLLGIPAIAVSLVTDEKWDFSYAAEFISRLLKKYQKEEVSDDVILNVNVPVNCNGRYRITKLGNRSYKNTFEQRIDPRGERYYWLAGEAVEEGNSADTDVSTVKDGLVSITPVKFSLTADSEIERLKKWNL
ncbi:5'/3'-nucleotidase SurE [Orenia metallireducens]|jgi:5'-nucleotidase|uniref:5'-nucleotidase SurE n=1 Tax=Orenia metallireducens TaxID=1413210 RepID=A0A1C0AA64_9FIRM|nr:5'/3'-nucleotidase SurE [Orenia metallireducens]OCL27184.1 5'/3'-nucleotidase SurE [Orenia metallireducens]